MRPLHRLLFVLAVVFSSFSAKSQVILTIDTLINFPDTAIAGQTYFPTVVVKNTGSTPFQGTLQVGIQTQNPTGVLGLLYFNNNPILLVSNDTVWLTPPSGFVFDSALFRPGNNVVVVWPVVTQAVALIDTLHTNVFLQTTSGLSAPEAPTLLLSPVPAHEFLLIRADAKFIIEYVRIFDITGRAFPAENQSAEDGRYELYLGGLPSGNYILETIFRNAPPSRARFVHLQ